MRRAITRRCDGEDGVTLVELMVTMMVMGIIVAAVFSVLFTAYRETGVVVNRRDVLADGQFAMQQMTKQFRQATVVNDSTLSLVDVDTYVNGVAKRIVWRVTGTQAPYTLETQEDGGVWVSIASSLADPNVFTYTPPDEDFSAHIAIVLPLTTTTTTIRLRSDVEMRNL